MHEQSIKEMLRKARQQQQTTERQSNTTQLTQKVKIGCLGWDSNPRPSALQAMLLPTKLPRQLSWPGSNPVYKSHSISTWYTGELKLDMCMVIFLCVQKFTTSTITTVPRPTSLTGRNSAFSTALGVCVGSSVKIQSQLVNLRNESWVWMKWIVCGAN